MKDIQEIDKAISEINEEQITKIKPTRKGVAKKIIIDKKTYCNTSYSKFN